MATKKDLVEAYAFSRRRLVTAFVSGAPGGREVEPSRPGRTVIGGLALAILLIAGAAIASVLASRTQEDWNKVGLVLSRQRGAPYVILSDSPNPTLIPVANITSAQLILGADIEPTYVDEEVLDDQTPGETIGIGGAPQTLPPPRQFIESGWTACTGDGLGMAVEVSETEKVTVPDEGGVIVESDGAYWVIARSGELDLDQRRAHRYLLPEGDSGELLLAALGLDNRAEAPTVPAEWLTLFPQGGDLGLGSFGITDLGTPLADLGITDPELPEGSRVGDYVVDSSGDSGVFLTADGKASPLDGFALAVYANSALPDDPTGLPRRLDVDLPRVAGAERAYDAAHWPDGSLQEVRGQVCARLDARHADVPLVDLAAEPEGTAAVEETLLPGQRQITIDQGHGAFVRSGDWDETTSTSTYVIDPRGQAYALVGGDTVAQLGYADTGEAFIPDTWLKLFAQGVALSRSKALCPPGLPLASNPDDLAEPTAPSSPAADATAGPVGETASGCLEYDG